MKIKSIANLGLVAAMVAFTSCDKQKRQDKLTSAVDSVSYALGLDISNQIKLNLKEANNAAFIKGFVDSEDSLKVKLKKEDIKGILSPFFMKRQQEAMARANDSTATPPVVIGNTNTSDKLLNQIDTVSYALGLNMAYSVKPVFEDINVSLFVQGYEEADDSLNVLIKTKDLGSFVSPFMQKKQQELMQKQQAKAAIQAEKEFGPLKEAGIKFLEENKKKKGVVTTASGLQYEVLKKGNSNKPAATDNVTVHYHGTTPEGTIFDSSVDRGEPSSFGLNQVIKGWTEGLQLMGEGAKYKFTIPQELAYGANPRGAVIKPFMPLVFEVELIKINK